MKRYNLLIFILLVISFSLLTASGAADILPPSPPETQGISTVTQLSGQGNLIMSAKLSWGLSSEGLGVNNEYDLLLDEEGYPILDENGNEIYSWFTTPEPPLSALQEVQMHTTYSENTLGNNGQLNYTKGFYVDTAAKPAAANNIESDRLFNFVGYNGGRLYSQEDLMLSTVGTGVFREFSSLCPVCTGACPCPDPSQCCWPPFCNTLQTGSTIDMTMVSAGSSSGVRNVNEEGFQDFEGFNWPINPSVDNPSRVSYDIRVHGITPTQPSVGQVSVYLDVHSIEDRVLCFSPPGAFSEMTLKEHRLVDGKVSLFDYSVRYESGIVR